MESWDCTCCPFESRVIVIIIILNIWMTVVKDSSELLQLTAYCLLFSVRIIIKELAYIVQQYLSLKYQMSLGNNNASSLLLAWVNYEWQLLNRHSHIYDFEQLKNSSFIYELLQKIHGKYFSRLNHLSYDFTSYQAAIEGYLIEIEGKKLSRSYKKSIIEGESVEDVIKIVLFMLLQSEHKSEYISHIVELSVQLQTFLMEELKQINTYLQNHIEIKDILSTVQKLEEENEQLKQKLKAYTEMNNQLSQVVYESRKENYKIESEVHKYEAEKKQILEELQIVDLKEYIEIYKNIKQENEQLSYCIQDIQEKKREVQAENEAMKEKISEDCHIISSLNQQITNIKSNYHQIKEEMTSMSFSYQQRDSFEDSILRENKNFNNYTKTRQSLETTCSFRHSIILNQLQDEEEDSEAKIRQYNNEIMQKLEHAYKTITELTNETSVLRDEKSKLEKKNVFLERKMNDLKKEQSRFMKELRKMGF